MYGYRTHSVDETYLSGAIGDLVKDDLTQLHRECVMNSANLTLSAATVPVNSTFDANLDVRNQNGRPLLGRTTTWGYNGYLFQLSGSSTFRAMVPRADSQTISASVDGRLFPSAQVLVPRVSVQASFAEEDYDLGWVVVLSSNGDQDSPPPTTPPQTHWDGSEGSCAAQVRKNSTGTAYEIWQLAGCGRQYSVVGAPTALASGRPVTALAIWRNAAGQQVGAGCDEHYCIASLELQLYDQLDELVGSSALISVGGGGAGLRTFLPSRAFPSRTRLSAPRQTSTAKP